MDAVSRSSDLREFYKRLKDIRAYYDRLPGEQAVPLSVEFAEFLSSREDPDQQNLIDFSDEEGYGRFLDMNECFQLFCNIKSIPKTNYLSYLSSFDKMYEIPKSVKNTSDYRNYIQSLHDYLYDFLSRIKPLLPLDEILDKYELEQKRQYEIGAFPGWPKDTAPSLSHSGADLDLTGFSSAEELASLGLDRLKSALMAKGMKCGGTLEQRAARLWASRGIDAKDLPAELLASSKKSSSSSTDQEKNQAIAMLEARVYKLSELLTDQKAATIENVQRKQALTAGERDDSEDEISDMENENGDNDDESEVIYNPKNLPLGWDGKPIPYWLYKLHGLNITYTCEICGNATYRGPKAFQRHFAEWRHAHGMRCLQIPNTAHFANVTSIEDAMKLWNKLKEEKAKAKFQPLAEEEYEDSEGRVVNKKTYEDLKRQGLL
jgi:splicing factor 3A subunit 3